jgi:putative hydrolase of the HAD superfamily
LGILSNWDWHLPELCEQLELASYFDFIVVSARVGCSKPNPCIFREMLRQAGTTPERTLHVGDSLSADVRGAQAVGITGVLIDRNGASRPDGYPVVRSLTEVLGLL